MLLAAIVATPLQANTNPPSKKEKPTPDRTIKGDQKGSTLESMTIEGEDKIRIEFQRPKLELNIDPTAASGLEWDVVWSLLEPSALDLYRPLSERSEHLTSSYRSRPWLNEFRDGDVVSFRTDVEGAASWSMTVVDSRGETVSQLSGEKNPPKKLGWDGHTLNGEPALPGLRYSFVLEAADRAGNKRRFVGDGFELPSYKLASATTMTFLFSGNKAMPVDGIAAPAILDAASQLNQAPATSTITITVTASDFKNANARGEAIARDLRPLLLGDPARVRVVTDIRKGIPEHGSVNITLQ